MSSSLSISEAIRSACWSRIVMALFDCKDGIAEVEDASTHGVEFRIDQFNCSRPAWSAVVGGINRCRRPT
jgi:hypothetical protein